MEELRSAVKRLVSGPTSPSLLDSVIDVCLESTPSDEEIAELATALGESGEMLPVAGPGNTDVASTGSPGSLTTILTPLLCSAVGTKVRKITVPGRPAGSVDVFGAIPGYRADLDRDQALEVVGKCGYVQLLAGTRWAPLDSLLFRRRQERGAQAIVPLVIASILAKKIAAGLRSFVLDVRAAKHGNFGTSVPEATEYATRLTRVAALLGIKAACQISAVDTPPQPYIGRGEALLALDELTRTSSPNPWLSAHAEECRRLATLATGADVALSPRDVRASLIGHLSAQGVASGGWEAAVEELRRQPRFEVRADTDGIVNIDLNAVRAAITDAQRTHAKPAIAFPDPCGVILERQPGVPVRLGDVLATIRVDTAGGADISRLASAIRSIGIED